MSKYKHHNDVFVKKKEKECL